MCESIGVRGAASRASWWRRAYRSTLMKMTAKYSTAGSAAASATFRYGTFSSSAIRNAPAPMIGGMIWPPAEALASTPAAKAFG